MNDISTRQGPVPPEHERASRNQCYKKKQKKNEALVTLTPHAPSQLLSCPGRARESVLPGTTAEAVFRRLQRDEVGEKHSPQLVGRKHAS